MPPLAPPRRPQRLGSLGNSSLGSFKKQIPRPAKKSGCGCEVPVFEIIDGAKICLGCGTQVSEQNIVAEVTFGETSSGAATVEGGIVNENSRHAKTLGAAAARRLGASMQSREDSENNGRESLRLFTARLPIAPDIADKAMGIWKLASNDNFTQGRRADEVAGACLYVACRHRGENTILLMDIAEIISVNVFSLGDTYKGLMKSLSFELKESTKMIEIEPLILKYASKLEFGEKTRQVAEDAVKIIRRMKRDWIVTGRHPAGLCGACLILAARMNNFRRTVREVVFVVKVADLTTSGGIHEDESCSTQDCRFP
jgi:transcription factor IIIB subunit 2